MHEYPIKNSEHFKSLRQPRQPISSLWVCLLCKCLTCFSVYFTCASSWPCSPGSRCPVCILAVVIAAPSSDKEYKNSMHIIDNNASAGHYIHQKQLLFPLVFLFCSGHLSWSPCSGKKKRNTFCSRYIKSEL